MTNNYGSVVESRNHRMADILAHSAKVGDIDLSAVPLRDAETDILDGNSPNAHCCCRKSIIDGIGAGYTVYECREFAVGECRWRIGSEPSTDCLYKKAVRMGYGIDDRPINSCLRIEAHEEADRIWGEEHIDDTPRTGPV